MIKMVLLALTINVPVDTGQKEEYDLSWSLKSKGSNCRPLSENIAEPIFRCGTAIQNNVTVHVDLQDQCTTSVYPPGVNRIDVLYTSLTNSGLPFGQSTNSEATVNFNINTFVAASGFSLPTADVRRRMTFEDAPTNINQALVSSISVSECPGDFTKTATCVKNDVSRGQTMLFSTKQSDVGDDTICSLDHTKTYYINYIHTGDPYNGQSRCSNINHQTCALFYAEGVF